MVNYIYANHIVNMSLGDYHLTGLRWKKNYPDVSLLNINMGEIEVPPYRTEISYFLEILDLCEHWDIYCVLLDNDKFTNLFTNL